MISFCLFRSAWPWKGMVKVILVTQHPKLRHKMLYSYFNYLWHVWFEISLALSIILSVHLSVRPLVFPCSLTNQKKTPSTSEAILKEKKAISSKDVAEAQRSMDIAKERGMALKQILSHDLLSSSPLFAVTFLPMSISQNLLVRLNLDWTSPNGVGSLLLLLMLS